MDYQAMIRRHNHLLEGLCIYVFACVWLSFMSSAEISSLSKLL